VHLAQVVFLVAITQHNPEMLFEIVLFMVGIRTEAEESISGNKN
jgi:hypothetical protein